jgi:adsorption protein B
LPRQVWSNIINGVATNRAIYIFLRAKLLGKRIAWDKTAHVLPTHVVAAHSRRRIGEMLVARGAISPEQLQAALEMQKGGQAPLGSILVLLGSISEDELLTVVVEQTRRPRRTIDPWLTPIEVLRTVEHRWAVAFSVYPLEILSNGAILLATADPLSRSEQSEIESEIGRAVELCWAPRAQVALAIRYGYQRGELIEGNQAENESQQSEVSEFSDLARSGGYRRLGDLLIEQGAVGFRDLKLAAKQFALEGGCRFGEFLLKYGYVSREDLDEALRRQQVACELQAE